MISHLLHSINTKVDSTLEMKECGSYFDLSRKRHVWDEEGEIWPRRRNKAVNSGHFVAVEAVRTIW